MAKFKSMRFVLIILMLWASVQLNAATASMSIEGGYYGENLLIYNPFSESESKSFSITSIRINDKLITESVQTSTIVINFAKNGLALEDRVNLTITYDDSQKPLVINPEALVSRCELKLVSTKFDRRSNTLSWVAEGEECSIPYIIEQKRWNRWIKIGEIVANANDTLNEYSLSVTPHSGANILRIKTETPRGEKIVVPEIKFRQTGRAVEPSVDKAGTLMSFSDKTMYEIYNEYGEMVLSGFNHEVNITALPKGLYVMNYDAETVMFAKK